MIQLRKSSINSPKTKSANSSRCLTSRLNTTPITNEENVYSDYQEGMLKNPLTIPMKISQEIKIEVIESFEESGPETIVVEELYKPDFK